MEIKHDLGKRMVIIETEEGRAYVVYASDEHVLDIRHTFVPLPLEGRGLASMMVQYTCDYAWEHHLKVVATCPYAAGWLKRHPEYGLEKN